MPVAFFLIVLWFNRVQASVNSVASGKESLNCVRKASGWNEEKPVNSFLHDLCFTAIRDCLLPDLSRILPWLPRWWTVTWQTKYKPFVPRLLVVTVLSTAAERQARTHSFGDIGRRCTRRTTEDRVEGRNTTERRKFLLSKTNRTSQLTEEQKGRLWYLLGLGLLGKL